MSASIPLDIEEEIKVLIENCSETLKSLVYKAIQFKNHRRRLKLTIADIESASGSFFLNEESEQSSTKNIDLESYIENIWEKLPDITYSSRCLSCPKYMWSHNFNMDKNLEDYYTFIIKSLFTRNCELNALFFNDLKKNSVIFPLLPIFLDSLCNDYILMKYKAVYLNRILSLMYFLFLNPYLHFRNQDIYKLINFVLSVLTSNLPAMSSRRNDCCSLQNNAAKFLNHIILKSPKSKFLYDFSLNKLQASLEDSEIKLQICYGALVALIEIELPAIARVIPRIFVNFSQKLKKEMCCYFSQEQLNSKCHKDCSQNIAHTVHTKLLDACELLLKHYLHEAMHSSQIRLDHCCTFSKLSNSYICEEVGDEAAIFKACKNILEYFGNILISRQPSLKDKLNGKQSLLEYFTGTTLPEEELSKDE